MDTPLALSGLLKLFGAEVAQGRVQTLTIVEHFDVFEDARASFRPRCIAFVVNQFLLQGGEEVGYEGRILALYAGDGDRAFAVELLKMGFKSTKKKIAKTLFNPVWHDCLVWFNRDNLHHEISRGVSAEFSYDLLADPEPKPINIRVRADSLTEQVADIVEDVQGLASKVESRSEDIGDEVSGSAGEEGPATEVKNSEKELDEPHFNTNPGVEKAYVKRILEKGKDPSLTYPAFCKNYNSRRKNGHVQAGPLRAKVNRELQKTKPS